MHSGGAPRVWTYIHLRGSPKLMHHLHGTVALLLSPSVGVALLLQVAESDVRAQQRTALPRVVVSEHRACADSKVRGRSPSASGQRPKTHRRRGRGGGRVQGTLEDSAMHKAGDGNSSFPSGDVAGVVAFAYPLLRCSGSSLWPPLVACACIALSALAGCTSRRTT